MKLKKILYIKINNIDSLYVKKIENLPKDFILGMNLLII